MIIWIVRDLGVGGDGLQVVEVTGIAHRDQVAVCNHAALARLRVRHGVRVRRELASGAHQDICSAHNTTRHTVTRGQNRTDKTAKFSFILTLCGTGVSSLENLPKYGKVVTCRHRSFLHVHWTIVHNSASNNWELENVSVCQFLLVHGWNVQYEACDR